ncbi:Amino acid transporter [Fasciolopsis buskii]|uniref:Amino acid transporter n=1 Tax=Fasciolopsis buskii TaxID=27845 RepID=A0A8E0S3K7_9TREM|nr:Amino acid transporter [Fasciolopsis buski]
MILAVILGVLIGALVKYLVRDVSTRTATLVGYPGELLMNMLKMLIIPLIVSTLISGLADLDTKSCGKIGSWAMGYYVVTTMMAVILGIILVVSIHPGSSSIRMDRGVGTLAAGRKPGTLDAFLDLFRNLFPENIVQACTHQVSSRFVNKTIIPDSVKVNTTDIPAQVVEVLETHYIDTTNVLGLVTFSVAFGLCIGQMGERGRPMLVFFTIMDECVMRLIRLIMWYAPIGIVFMVVGKIIGVENLADTAQGLGLYMLTVILGLFIHLFGTLALFYFAVTRKNPFKFFKGMLQAFFTALGTGSSSATLPVTFSCLEEKLHIDPRVTRFVLPIGATINMDGTALYEAVATIFIAQMNDYQLGIAQLLTISLTATLAAIGAASVPSAGLVTMVLVLSSVGLPVNDITLILAVDWMLDRMRTAVNVMGDSYGAAIVAHLCRKQLAALGPPIQVHPADDKPNAEGADPIDTDMELTQAARKAEGEIRV